MYFMWDMRQKVPGGGDPARKTIRGSGQMFGLFRLPEQLSSGRRRDGLRRKAFIWVFAISQASKNHHFGATGISGVFF